MSPPAPSSGGFRSQRPRRIPNPYPSASSAVSKRRRHYSDRRGLAQLHGELFGPISPRTLEEWPVAWQLVNGRAVTNTREAIELAYRRFQDAPKYRAGRAKSAEGVE